MQAPAPIPVFRPSYLTDGVEFQGSLTESPANVFYQRVNASIASLNRMQFQWRSVSDQLLVSPVIMLRFRIKVQCPQLWNQLTAFCNVHGLQTCMKTGPSIGVTGADEVAQIGVPSVQFADGDALASVASSINLTFNGTSLSLNRTNRWWRDYTRTQLASDDAARIYKSSGGCYNQNDARGVAVPALYAKGTGGRVDGGDVRGILAGIVQDSGIAERTKNLFSMGVVATTSARDKVDTHGTMAENTRIIQISYPVPVPPCNPWRGAPLPATCPYKNCPLAIPHFSAGGLDFLFEDFERAFIRYLGSGTSLNTAFYGTAKDYAANVGLNTSTSDVKISYVDKSAELEIKYFRLSHTRSLKESYRFNVWQAQTFPGPLPPVAATAPHVDVANYDPGAAGVSNHFYALPPCGQDFASVPAGYHLAATDLRDTVNHASMISGLDKDLIWTCNWDTISLAQVPSFLLISAPKLSSSRCTPTVMPCYRRS